MSAAAATDPGAVTRNLSAGALAMAVVLIAFLAFASWQAWRLERATILEDLKTTAEVESRALDLYFERHEHALRSLRDDIADAQGRLGPQPQVHDALSKALARESDWTAVAVNTPDGNIVDSTRSPASGRAAGTDWDLAVEALRGGATMSVGRGMLGRLTKQWVAPLRFPVRDRDGRLTHVISAAIPLSRPISFWDGAHFPPGAGVSVIVIQDVVYLIARHPQPAGSKPEDLYGKPRIGPFAAAILEGALPNSGNYEGPSTVIGESAFFGYARSKRYALMFVVQSPTSLLWHRWWAQVWPSHATLAVLLLGGFAVYRWIAAREAASAQAATEGQRRLHASEERLALVVKGTRDGVWDWNLRTGEIYLSPRWKEILGYADEELPDAAAAFFDRLHPDDKQAITAAVQRLTKQHDEAYAVEIRLRHKDGAYRWIHTRGQAVRNGQGAVERVVGSIADISVRKRFEESLRASEERYRQIVETAREGIWVIDENNLTTLANARLGEILGWDADALIGTSMFDHTDAQGRAVAAASDERRRQGKAEEHEFPFRRQDGSTVWTQVATNPLFDADGRYTGALAMVTDITDRKLAEGQIRTALREKETLLKEIYHRVKNNLQVIASLLSLQGRDLRYRAARAMLEDSANRIKSMALVHEQLYQGRDLSSVDFSAYLGQLVSHLSDAHGAAARRAPIRLSAQPLQLGIETAVPLGLIINELLSNAYKHAFPGARTGAVTLQLAVLDDGSVELAVSDDGVGMPAGFDPEASTSLGMRLVVSLTEQLGGTLQHLANDGGGTRFVLRFAPDDSERQRMRSVVHDGDAASRAATSGAATPDGAG